MGPIFFKEMIACPKDALRSPEAPRGQCARRALLAEALELCRHACYPEGGACTERWACKIKSVGWDPLPVTGLHQVCFPNGFRGTLFGEPVRCSSDDCMLQAEQLLDCRGTDAKGMNPFNIFNLRPGGCRAARVQEQARLFLDHSTN